MTKADLVARVRERLEEGSQAEVGAAVEAVLAIIRDCLVRGEGVKIAGFGSFIVNRKAARRGRNPQTGEAITIAPRAVLSFRPSEALRARVAAGSQIR
ncbi:MAG TPA: integration host factor subunit alpha [Candidatus Binataceae bacterium]|jgi:integration host factor subunit alpha|nr:integration host factor subunit alpha [Candidatus Binataceae bacterium]